MHIVCAALVVGLWMFAVSQAQAEQAEVQAAPCDNGKDCSKPGLISDFNPDIAWSVRGGLAVTGRAATTDQRGFGSIMTAGFDIALAEGSCTWLGGSVDVHRESRSGDTVYWGTRQLTACLPIPMLAPQVTLTVDREIEPRLSAIPDLNASRVSGVDVLMRGSLMRLMSNTLEVRGFAVEYQIHSMNQLVSGMRSDVDDNTLRASIIEGMWPGEGFQGEDERVQIGHVSVTKRTPNTPIPGQRFLKAITAHISPVTITGWHPNGAGYYLDIDVGMAAGWLQVPGNGGSPEVLVESHTVHVDVRLSQETEYGAYRVGYTHTLQPSTHGSLIFDHRFAGQMTHPRGRWTLAGHGFAALTMLVDDREQRDYQLTGGVTGRADVDLGHGIQLGVSVDLAHSFYAIIRATSTIEADWSARAMAELSAQFGS